MKKFVISLIIILVPIILIFIGSTILFDDKDYCLDTGKCIEGLEVNTEYGKVKITKENCLKYNWKWNEEKKWCDLNK